MQDSTPHSQAQQQVTTPEKCLALKELFTPSEYSSSIDSTPLIKDTATLSEESKGEKLVRKHSLQTGIPSEFKDEVRLYRFKVTNYFLYSNI